MADYNVQMKQFNGTSFDNILPYASQALTLAGGGSATEIITQARAGLSQIATGSYVGNGVYTSPTRLNIGFRPKSIFFGTRKSVSKKHSNGYVNGVKTNYSSFDGTMLGDDAHAFFGIMSLSVDVPFIYNAIDAVGENYDNVLIMEELNGVVTITQKCYYSTDVYSPEQVDFRNADYQFNKNGVTYDYIAIG